MALFESGEASNTSYSLTFVLITPKFTVKLGVIYTRTLQPPTTAYFLFGPRGTGKSTWLQSHYSNALVIDLLPRSIYLDFQRDPELLRKKVLAVPKSEWVIVDEIQKIPDLLDDVHFLMEREGYKKFILTGSSARKLKKGAANLLGGRAIVRHMLPLTLEEINFSLPQESCMRYGMLPLSVTAPSNEIREDFLRSYIETYLSEEVKAESFVRNLGSFTRFLEVAALVAGKPVSILGLSRDVGIGRDSVRSYFSILEDTLIGSWLPAFKPRAKIKEVATPKFYWFDSGVLHAAAGGLRQPMPADWDGVLFEHWLLHEMRAYMEYHRLKGNLGYWSTPHQTEIDFVYWYGNHIVAIEAKASKRFRTEYLKGMDSFEETKKLASRYIVYLGEEELRVGNTQVLPVFSFLKKLHAGEVFF